MLLQRKKGNCLCFWGVKLARFLLFVRILSVRFCMSGFCIPYFIMAPKMRPPPYWNVVNVLFSKTGGKCLGPYRKLLSFHIMWKSVKWFKSYSALSIYKMTIAVIMDRDDAWISSKCLIGQICLLLSVNAAPNRWETWLAKIIININTKELL